MKIEVEINEIELDGDYCQAPGICATCTKCGHQTYSFGTSEASVRRCLALMREECPEGEINFYREEQ